MNGFDRKDLAVPVLFIAADNDVTTGACLERSGAAGHLQNPVEDNTMLDAIGRAVRVVVTFSHVHA